MFFCMSPLLSPIEGSGAGSGIVEGVVVPLKSDSHVHPRRHLQEVCGREGERRMDGWMEEGRVTL